MTDEVIAGHEGIEVIRTADGILKRGYEGVGKGDNLLALQTEAKFLKVMAGCGFTPKLLVDYRESGGVGEILQEDLGKQEPMRDGELFRRNLVRVLYEVRKRKVRHGDLRIVDLMEPRQGNLRGNLLLRNDWPRVVDWQDAHFIGEPAPQLTPFSDSWGVWKTVEGEVSVENGVADFPRVARRWLAVLGALGALQLPRVQDDYTLKGASLMDLGCFQGDFVAAGAAEGMLATGIDSGGFRSGEDSIAIAKEMWPWPECTFEKRDIMTLKHFRYDVVLLFSTWSYIVKDHGLAAAVELLRKIIADCGVLFFENQLHGDGPGPECFPDDDAIAALLGRFGNVKALWREIPVSATGAKRTVWEVRG